jgi:hypothetical protein
MRFGPSRDSVHVSAPLQVPVLRTTSLGGTRRATEACMKQSDNHRAVASRAELPAADSQAGKSVRNVRQQGHEPRLLDRQRHGMLAGGGATALASANDLALAVRQLREQLQILIVDIHRPGPLAVDKYRVFLFRTNLVLVRATFGNRSSRSFHNSWPSQSCLGNEVKTSPSRRHRYMYSKDLRLAAGRFLAISSLPLPQAYRLWS